MTCHDYLESKGVRLIPARRGWNCICPVPSHEDNDPSCYVYEDGGNQNWFCFGCRCSGYATDIYGLVMAVEQCGFHEAVEIVGEPPAVRAISESTDERRNKYIRLIDPQVSIAYRMGVIRTELLYGGLDFDAADHLYRSLWNGAGLSGER